MVFIREFIETLKHSLFDPDQLKVDMSTCRPCPQVKMLFMSSFISPFIEPLCPLSTIQLLASIPSLHFHQLVEGEVGRDCKEGKEGWGLGSAYHCWVKQAQAFPSMLHGILGALWLRTEEDEGVVDCSQSFIGLWISHYSLIGHLEQQHHSPMCTLKLHYKNV